MIVKLSNGEAHLKDYIDVKTTNEYRKVVREGMETTTYFPTQAELDEIEKLPIAERLKVKQDLAPKISLEKVGAGQKYLVEALIEKLIIDGDEKAITFVNTIDEKDYQKIEEAVSKLYLKLQEKEEDKKK